MHSLILQPQVSARKLLLLRLGPVWQSEMASLPASLSSQRPITGHQSRLSDMVTSVIQCSFRFCCDLCCSSYLSRSGDDQYVEGYNRFELHNSQRGDSCSVLNLAHVSSLSSSPTKSSDSAPLPIEKNKSQTQVSLPWLFN